MDYDFFISYASEDKKIASEIAMKLESFGLKVWFDDTEIKIGDDILKSINNGLKESAHGIVILSPDFMKRKWTEYELGILTRQNIEEGKKIFPVWHNVTKEEVQKFSIGLANIFAERSDIGIDTIVGKIIGQAYKDISTLAVVPLYENPVWRFTQGRGELTLADNKGTFTLWEAILHFKNEQYPIGVAGKIFTKEELIFHASQVLDSGGLHILEGWLGKERARLVVDICKKSGMLAFDPY